MHRIIGSPGRASDDLLKKIKNLDIDYRFISSPRTSDFREIVYDQCSESDKILDCGRSMRDLSSKLSSSSSCYHTLDINKFDDYPTFICDLCVPEDIPEDLQGYYDKTICLAVLEHCYNPFKAAESLIKVTKKGGRIYMYAPFIFRYHAPERLDYQDYFRFTRDSWAALFPNAQKITLYPERGYLTTAANFVLPGWKKYVEGVLRYRGSAILDRLVKPSTNILQCSGWHVIVHL